MTEKEVKLRNVELASQITKITQRNTNRTVFNSLFTTSVSLGKGHGQHAAIKVRVQVQGMTNGPISAKQVNRSSSAIG